MNYWPPLQLCRLVIASASSEAVSCKLGNRQEPQQRSVALLWSFRGELWLLSPKSEEEEDESESESESESEAEAAKVRETFAVYSNAKAFEVSLAS